MKINYFILVLIFVSGFSPSFSLLRNCVTPAEWNKDTTTPKCEIITNSTDAICYGPNEISVPRGARGEKVKDLITVSCKADYPLDVDVNGIKLKGFPGIFPVRHVTNISDPTTYEYTVTIPLYAVGLWSPRWYIIKSFQNPNIQTAFYIYRPGPNDPVLSTDWSSEKIRDIIIKPDGRYATLPCVVSHYTDVVVLNKFENGFQKVETDGVAVRFEPKAGFIVDTLTEPPPWGLYRCTAENPRTRQKENFIVNLENPNGLIVSPEQNETKIFEGEKLHILCQSNNRVELNGLFNTIPIPQSNFTYTEDENLVLKYKAEFIMTSMRASDAGSIHCLSKSSGKLHVWRFDTIDLRQNDFLQFTGDGTTDVSCESKTSQLNLFSGECFNFPQCKSRLDFYNTLTTRQCELELLNVINCGQKCKHSTSPNSLCLSSDQLRINGVFLCEASKPELSKLIHFVKGWTGKLYTNLRPGLNGVPTEELIRISTGKGLLYKGDVHTFKCEAASFLSNGEYQWYFKDDNGTLIQPTIKAVRGKHDYWKFNNSIWEADIHLDNDNIHSVTCLVPKWNSDEWAEISKEIQIEDPERPNIPDAGSNVKFFIGEEGRTLNCHATGLPQPTLMWKVNGKNVTQPYSVLTGEDGDLILEFPKVTDSINQDVFTCIATNFMESYKKTFHVEAAHKPHIVPFIILGIVLLVLLIITLVVLYWKLMKAKSRIRDLSDEEVHEFLNGNPKAAEVATEPQELILLLPYNLEYEIELEKLKFDEKDVLGCGAFGIVFRGKLDDHQDEVAIKTIKPHSAVSYFKALLSELKIMIYIGKHENVVQLIGAYTGNIKERKLYMVVELSPYGNLENYLRFNQRSFQNEIRDDRICFTKNMMQVLYTNMAQRDSGYINSLSTTELVSWSLQIAEGMSHLANKKVIHADLATRNVLLYDNGVVKITDFGLSRQLYAYTTYMKKEQEPLPWRSMAIESLREMNFSTQSDVWAYGVTLWEIFSLGAVPYPGLSWSIDFVDKLTQGLRLTRPQYATSEIYNIMIQCWHFEPSERPSFVDLRNKFKNIYNDVKGNDRK